MSQGKSGFQLSAAGGILSFLSQHEQVKCLRLAGFNSRAVRADEAAQKPLPETLKCVVDTQTLINVGQNYRLIRHLRMIGAIWLPVGIWQAFERACACYYLCLGKGAIAGLAKGFGYQAAKFVPVVIGGPSPPFPFFVLLLFPYHHQYYCHY